MRVLVLNAGSSSVKFAVVDAGSGSRSLEGQVEGVGSGDAGLMWSVDGCDSHRRALGEAGFEEALEAVAEILDDGDSGVGGVVGAVVGGVVGAVGHRVVHGGERFGGPTVVDAGVEREIEHLSGLAPLHNPVSLRVIRWARSRWEGLAQVAVFDTAFHQTLPESAYRYGVPRSWYTDHGVRKYGFHGTSHRFVSQRAAAVLGKALEDTTLVTLHLGAGCSAAAVVGGRSVDTTMGLTPLGGMMMATRSGDLDPAVVGYIAQQTGTDVGDIVKQLNAASGMLGVSGVSGDMRKLRAIASGTVEASAEDRSAAGLAVRMFVERAAKQAAAMAVSACAGGRSLDGLVFTAGIGEHDAATRAEIVARLGVMGLRVDEQRNAEHGRDTHGVISAEGSAEHAGAVMVVPTDEQWMIAQEVAGILEGKA